VIRTETSLKRLSDFPGPALGTAGQVSWSLVAVNLIFGSVGVLCHYFGVKEFWLTFGIVLLFGFSFLLTIVLERKSLTVPMHRNQEKPRLETSMPDRVIPRSDPASSRISGAPSQQRR
jgi:hypothetical protein